MSLLDCICCPEHDYRTAVVSDDLKISSADTYGCMIERACILACYLRRKFNEISGQREEEAAQPDRVVGILSESCSEALSAILGILAVPASFMPLNCGRDDVARGTKRRSQTRMALVHHTFTQDFLSAELSDSYVTVDTTTLQLGFLCVTYSNHHIPSTPPLPSLPPSFELCTSTDRCRECASLTMPPLPPYPFLQHSMNSYHSHTHHLLAHCTVCSKHSAKNTNDYKNYKRSINSISEYKDSRTRRKWNFPALSPTALAYIVHTSGTTGTPKPVRVPHCCIVPNILDLTQRFSLSPSDTVFNAAPLTFDPSLVEIFLALYNGATLLTVSSRVKRSPHQLANVLFHRNQATVLQITPSLFRRLSERQVGERLLGDRSRVRVLALGGEQFPPLQQLSHHKSPSNVTLIFNIYGTTEVSSWSTCHRVTETHLERAREGGGEGGGEEEEEEGEGKIGVPIGDPMLGTILEVRDPRGKTVTKGYGEVFLGGEYRVCLLGDEISPAHSLMRPTGDIGWVSGEGEVYFVCREDRQIKRSGHRLSLDAVEQCVMSQDLARSCSVGAVSDAMTLSRLFPTPQMSPDYSQQRLVMFAVPQPPHPLTALQSEEWSDRLMTALVGRLPGHMVPDVIVPVLYLPFNRHGKVDIDRLLRFDDDPSLYITPLSTTTPPHHLLNGSAPLGSVQTVQDTLLTLALTLTPIPQWSTDATLLEAGATSFDVVRITDTWEGRFGKITALTDLLLTKTLKEVAETLWEKLSAPAGCEVGGRGGEMNEEPARKRARNESLENFPPIKAAVPSYTSSINAWRGGKVYINGKPAFASIQRGPDHLPEVAMSVKWTHDTGKCVDASPLVTVGDQTTPTVFIGSHSGVFVALCALSGRCLWKVQLSDRIESSACLSTNGTLVVVGCYDGYIYCLKAASGEVKWSLQLSCEPVKSSPCVDITSGLVWVGSHDQHLYAIHEENGRVVHRVFLGGGSCFSSPCLDIHRGLVYAATLRGNLIAVDKDSGCAMWMYKGGGKPFFSSPCMLPDGDVAIGSVDGRLHIVRSCGTMARVFRTADSLFSSPSVAVLGKETLGPEEERQAQLEDVTAAREMGGKDTGMVERSSVRLFCGSHDKCIYCWNIGCREGELLWKTPLDSEVYATPAPCTIMHTSAPHSATSNTSTSTGDTSQSGEISSSFPSPVCAVISSCVCVSTSSGVVYLLDVHTGKILNFLKLPGQVFSSPAVVNNHVLIGCRDDRIYCIKCSVTSHFD